MSINFFSYLIVLLVNPCLNKRSVSKPNGERGVGGGGGEKKRKKVGGGGGVDC